MNADVLAADTLVWALAHLIWLSLTGLAYALGAALLYLESLQPNKPVEVSS